MHAPPSHARERGRSMDHRNPANPEIDDDGDMDARIAQLVAERDDALLARQRALADFANFQRRANESEARAFQNGAARIIRGLLGPLDNFDLALEAGARAGSATQVLDGVKLVRGEIAKALAEHGVTTIVPARGDEFDPMRHEAMLREAAPDLPGSTVVRTLQPGYAMGELVLRPAKVAVSGG